MTSCVPGGYKSYSGTSMAAPHVAACAAIYAHENEDATPAQIEEAVKSKVLDLGIPGYDTYYGKGVPKLITGSENQVQYQSFSFGSYPQSKVTNSTLISALNEQEGTWKSYGYYSGDGYKDSGATAPSDYMRYKDVTYDGVKYRAVTFDAYRPANTYCIARASNVDTYQIGNGYTVGNVYWFRYDPLKWTVLDASTGLTICDNAIDAQAYSNYIKYNSETDRYYNDSGKYTSDWETSSLRAWLNDDFYNTAFSDEEKANILLSENETKDFFIQREDQGHHLNDGIGRYLEYNSNNTMDHVFLLTYTDVTNTAYGFAVRFDSFNDPARRRYATDYAKCQGLYHPDGYNDNLASWWLRGSGGNSERVCHVGTGGDVTYNARVAITCVGVCPAIRLDLSKIGTSPALS